MPRSPRINQPGLVFHVISRGNAKQEIFFEKRDWQRFLDLLSDVKNATRLNVLAYCLMPNHFHLLVRTGPVRLSTIMQQLLTRYAAYFNTRTGRVGHVFQSRFKAYLCDRDAYLLELVRYIHLNPVRA